MRASLWKGLLTLVGAMGGTLENRIRLHKSVYLLQSLGVMDFGGARFRYHHYGPYSRELSEVLHETVTHELLREEREDLPDGHSKYTYQLTDAGKVWLSECGSPHPDVARYASALASARWRALELASTVVFLERQDRIGDRNESLQRALALKPECKPFVDEARAVLETMSL